MNSDGWTVVRRGARPASKEDVIPHENKIVYQAAKERSTRRRRRADRSTLSAFELTRSRVLKIRDDLRQSTWWGGLVSHLEDACVGKPIASLQCLGIGSFANTANARHQLACALLLKEYASEHTHCSITDPAMLADDIRLAKDLGFEIVPAGSLAVQAPQKGSCVVLFMPHCGRDLNEQIVGECLTHPNGIVFVANCFSGYVLNDRSPACQDSAIATLVSANTLRERLCLDSNCSTSETAFNDLAVTTIDAIDDELLI